RRPRARQRRQARRTGRAPFHTSVPALVSLLPAAARDRRRRDAIHRPKPASRGRASHRRHIVQPARRIRRHRPRRRRQSRRRRRSVIMQRIILPTRLNWRKKVETVGLVFHTTDAGAPYWNESACYEFTSSEIDEVEKTTYTLNDLCLEAVDH